jgi:chemosensory pili system protein ChpA (sensor histidine kinase/response regulator)
MSSARLSNQSLQWTRPLLDELCEEVRRAVEQFGDEDQERPEAGLDEAIEACGKVAGSLAVMEFSSGQLIAEAMGMALTAMKNGEAPDEAQAISTVLEATAILPDYLDYLESTQRDAPLVVLPTINDLRTAAGAENLDELTFFQPDLDIAVLPESAADSGTGQSGIRRDYQHALRGILLNNQDEQALEKLTEVTLVVRDHPDLSVPVRRTGWAAAAVCEAMQQKQIASGPALTRLYARMDVLLKESAEGSEARTLADKADDLTRGFLYQIATAGAETPLASEVHQAFNLDEHAPDQNTQAKVFLAGRNRALFAAVTQAAREDLARIKDALGSQLERGNDPEVLQQQTALLESVGESLSMLGLDHLAARVKAQAGKLSELGTDHDDPALLMVARELLVVESQLEENFGLAGAIDADEDVDTTATLMPASEKRRVVKQLVKEALEDLAHAKHLLDAVNRQKADAGAVPEAQSILGRIAGALSMAEFDEVATMIEAASRIVGDHLSAGPADASAEALDTLAESLTVAEFYLESVTSLDERGSRYLTTARERLERLGYWPEEVQVDTAEPDAAVDSEQEPEVSEASVDTETEPSDDLEDALAELEAESDDSIAAESDDEPVTELELEDFDLEDESEVLDLDELSEDESFEADGEDALEEQPVAEEDDPHAEAPSEPETPDEQAFSEQGVDDQPHDEALGATESEESAEGEAEPGSAPDVDLTSAFDDFDIVEIFLEEFDQELESLQELVPQWQEKPDNEDHTVTIRRAFHSLKGSGRMAGAMEIGEFAWQIENLINRLLDRTVEATPQVTGLIAEAVAALPSMRARLSGDGPGELDEQSCAELAEKAGMIADGRSIEPEQPEEEAATLPPELEDLDPTLIELMVKELSENLETLDDWLAQNAEADHVEAIEEGLVRAVHTMKGTMRLAPIGDETETAQILEAYLEELSLCVAQPTDDGLRVMAQCSQLFHLRLERLCGVAVDDSEFQTAGLAEQLRELHNQAHRERTGEHAPAFSPLPGTQEQPSEEARTEELESEEPAFTSELDAETETEAESADFDFFDVDEDEVAAPEDFVPEALEGDEEGAEVSEAEPVDESAQEDELADESSEQPTDQADDETEADLVEEAEDDVAEAEFEVPGEDVEAEDVEEGAPATDAEQMDDEDLVEDELSAGPQGTEDTLLDSGTIESEFVPDVGGDEQPEEESGLAEEDDRGLVHIDYSEVNEDLLDAFLEEGQELLEHSDEMLQKWREAPDDKSLVTALQRDLHTIKGSSRMVGLNPIGQVAHVMEELLEGIATGLKDATPDRIDALENGCDHLHSMIDAVLKREPVPVRRLEDLFAAQAEEIEDTAIMPELATEAEQGAADEDQSKTARAETLRVPSTLIDELVNYAGEISIFRSRLEQQISVFRNNVGEVDETVIRLRDQLRKLEIETEAQILARYEREHGPADEAFDPLELDRYSTIQQLSRALAESVNDLTSLTGILDDATRQSETLLMQQSRVNTELQEGLMQARMVSFNTLLPRFRRVVRNASREVGKKIQLRVDLSGESELDRNVLDRITAPLEHLLRNAVSHGIELPEERHKLGKPETGTISIEVGREATELVMRIRDDGGGLNLDAIRNKAIDRGLLKAGEEVSEQGLMQMIFHAGFSTATEVSELAGRGIGMDVVSNEVRQIGGSVSAHSESGKGAMFVIRIPLSLTVMQAIMVRASDRHFAIPLQAVRGVTRILADEWLREIDTPEPQQDYAGEQYPLLELEPQLDLPNEEVSTGNLSLLMIEAGDQRAALRVAELLGHREIVIKPIGPQISSIPGILGGTITGDGQVVPILDMGPLIRRAFEKDLLPGHGGILEAERTQEVKRTPLVMVVDDSITMRRVTSRVLEHRGLEVVTARDGLDAIEAMFERVPDLILLDIEMPRMDGYELANHVRNDPRLKEVPMMMITSRSGEKHRQRARELGVNDYLAKPYQEAELVKHVFDLLEMAAPEG